MKKTKRINLVIPETLDVELRKISKKQGESLADTLKVLLKIGFTVWDVLQEPETELIIRKGQKEQTIKFAF